MQDVDEPSPWPSIGSDEGTDALAEVLVDEAFPESASLIDSALEAHLSALSPLSLSLSLYLSLSIYIYISLSISLSLYIYIYIYLSLSLSLSPSFSLSQSLPLSSFGVLAFLLPLPLFADVCSSMLCLPLSLYPFVYIYIFRYTVSIMPFDRFGADVLPFEKKNNTFEWACLGGKKIRAKPRKGNIRTKPSGI